MGTCSSCCQDPDRRKNGHVPSTVSNVSSSASRAEPQIAVTVADTRQSTSSSKYTVPNSGVVVGIPTSEQGGSRTAEPHLSEVKGDGSTTAAGLSVNTNTKASTSSKTASSVSHHQGKRVPSLSSKDLASDSKITSLFNTYYSEEDDCIGAEGVERFCRDLDITPDDFRILVLAWKFNAGVMCRFTRQEFTQGCKAIKVDSIAGIVAKMPELLQEVKDKSTFRTFYRWAFRFALDAESGQRNLPLDIALQLWPLVFTQNEPRILSSWLDYLQKHQAVRGIPRDTWDMFLNFSECVKDGFANYDDTEAWPSIFDNFVEYETDRQNQNVDVT